MEKKEYNLQRKDYISWDEYFMSVAGLSGMRSKDPNSQVGACIVSEDNRILSIGYNGAPNGFKDDEFPWDREGDPLETKYFYVCHAEMNAVVNYRGGSNKDLKNAKIYVYYFPCNECAKIIIQSGIKEIIIQSGIKEIIYCQDKYAREPFMMASKKLLDVCGVKYRKLDMPKEVKINF